MVQSDFAENIRDGEVRSGRAQGGELADSLRIDSSQVEYTDVMTGGKNRSRLVYYQLKRSIGKAKWNDKIVSFINESRVRLVF